MSKNLFICSSGLDAGSSIIHPLPRMHKGVLDYNKSGCQSKRNVSLEKDSCMFQDLGLN